MKARVLGRTLESGPWLRFPAGRPVSSLSAPAKAPTRSEAKNVRTVGRWTREEDGIERRAPEEVKRECGIDEREEKVEETA